MRLPASERKAQILRTAAELFSQQGYEGTKTSQIAREAGVNEAIIFRHFTNKEELYWAVLADSCAAVSLKQHLREVFNDNQTPEEGLTKLAEYLLDRIFNHPQLSRLLLFAALENHKLSHRFFRLYTATKYEELADYIREKVKCGVFRADVDPLLAARGFFAMLIYHFQIQELFGGKNVHQYDLKTVSQTFIRLWISGMSPVGEAAAQPRIQVRTRILRNQAVGAD